MRAPPRHVTLRRPLSRVCWGALALELIWVTRELTMWWLRLERVASVLAMRRLRLERVAGVLAVWWLRLVLLWMLLI